ETQQLPDLVLPRKNQTIAGVIVDAAGKPLAGVRMTWMATGPHATSELVPPGVTDAEGRFRLEGLPRGRISVMADLYDPEGPPARPYYHVDRDVESGTQDLRLVLDVPSRETGTVVGKPAPEFAVRNWLRRGAVPAGRGFAVADY